ncbi:GNAT family N-acetyltransferase [Lactiplantibacillus herbarum]|uniref:GNAT family N-acetyltransferase n=1 Tax=Lactiplantibacillus herbarum TaxID=1670446 RepID=UPI00064F428B|nr:GNAT family N-acetyltransferase [Lactiplantibacillus herbarum]
MNNVYQKCPQFTNEHYCLRLVTKDDWADLLQVYSDQQAVARFNSDNCGGDDFHYTTQERIQTAIDYWLSMYTQQGFVRWAIIDQQTTTAVGTIELFHRDAADYFDKCGVLRLDLRADYEHTNTIEQLLSPLMTVAFDLFNCEKIAIKIISTTAERAQAFTNLGFTPTNEALIGHDGTKYHDYWIKTINS